MTVLWVQKILCQKQWQSKGWYFHPLPHHQELIMKILKCVFFIIYKVVPLQQKIIIIRRVGRQSGSLLTEEKMLKLTQNEKSSIVSYCKENNIIDPVFETLEEVVNDFNSLETDTQFLDKEYLFKTVSSIQFVADWFDIELCYNIMSRGDVEEITMQHLIEYFNKYEELDLCLMKTVLSETALGHSIVDNYFIPDPYAPYFKLLTYDYMEILIGEVVSSIKEKVAEKGIGA